MSIDNMVHSISFENFMRSRSDGSHYWSARTIHSILGFSKWSTFYAIIKKAQNICTKLGADKKEHFKSVFKVAKVDDSYKRVIDFEISRFGCYLILKLTNGRSDEVGFEQVYFEIFTKFLELTEEQIMETLNLDIRENIANLRNNKKIIDNNIWLNQRNIIESTAIENILEDSANYLEDVPNKNINIISGKTKDIKNEKSIPLD